MFIKDSLRFNIHQRYTDPVTGEKGIDMTRPENRARFGVTEIPDPSRGNDEIEYTQELNEAPYIVITPKPQRMLDQQFNAKVKAQIAVIEAGQARAVREAALGNTTHLTAIETEIAALRATLIAILEEGDSN
jgi:hypothetical protein